MSDSQQYELIAKYINGGLSEEEKNTFEKRLKEDDVLAKNFRRYKLGSVAYGAVQFQNQFDRFSTLGRELELEKTNRLRKRRLSISIMAAAASILLLLFYNFFKEEPSIVAPPVAFNLEEHFELANIEGFTELGGKEEAWKTILSLYQEEKCQDVIEQSKVVLINNSLSNKENQLYLLIGSCQIKEQAFAEARNSLGKISPNATTVYEPAEWYLTLLDLKENQEIGLNKLNKIVQKERHGFNDKAKELLIELKK